MATEYTQITLPDLYPVVLAEVAFLNIFCICLGFCVAGSKRGALFTKEFMQEHFGETHEKETKNPIGGGGYPDCGNGIYSDKLSYKDWMAFNQDQRIHKNMIEQLTIISFLLLAAGVVHPVVTIILGGIYILARVLYLIGYKISPKGRLLGAPLVLLSLFGSFILAFVALI